MSVKPFKSYPEQLQLLKDRGLEVPDDAKVLHILEHHNYYRFSAYRFPFQDAVDQFRAGTTFEQLWKLYCFDRILRQLVSEACKAVELSDSDWKQRLRAHLETLSGPSHAEMGFPADWRDRDFWRDAV